MADTAMRDRAAPVKAPRKVARPASADASAPAPSRAPAHPHHDEGVATALANDAFKRERYEFLLRTLFVLLALLALSMTGNIYFAARDQQIRYFAMDPLGSVREVIPMSLPMQENGEIITWSAQAITKAFTMSFANYQQQLAEIRLQFDDAGWRGFEEALKRTKLLDQIIQQKLITSAAPAAAPVVLNSGLGAGGRYAWNVQMPIVVTYESASGRNTVQFNVEAVVIRRPESENPRGLGIAQIVAR